MGTGLIFTAIVLAWLAYLVPLYLRRHRTEGDGEEGGQVLAGTARIVATGGAPLVDHDGEQIADLEISTPMTRRSAVRRLAQLEARAARRRLRVLGALLLGVATVVTLAALAVLPWWSVAVPGGLLLLFGVASRLSVVLMVRHHERLLAGVSGGGDAEDTVVISAITIKDPVPAQPAAISGVVTGALWDPIPVTTPTYVSKPLAPRTVRTIDLSPAPPAQPVLAESAPLPIPDAVAADEQTERRATGS